MNPAADTCVAPCVLNVRSLDLGCARWDVNICKAEFVNFLAVFHFRFRRCGCEIAILQIRFCASHAVGFINTDAHRCISVQQHIRIGNNEKHNRIVSNPMIVEVSATRVDLNSHAAVRLNNKFFANRSKNAVADHAFIHLTDVFGGIGSVAVDRIEKSIIPRHSFSPLKY